ncbi:MAG TPA: DUF2442 domain-containing protein, partial [Rhodothermales bacterium]|nr:DUF2442 domain-containing protein [Rhodothermales bacterium]
MKETPYIRSVAPLEGTKLFVAFRNGEQRILDLKPFIDGSEFFSELNDPEYFRQVRLVWGGHGIDWPHEQDLSKDTVYAESKELFVAPQSVSDLIQ